uniref:RNase H type-1 domain-containing protein n=1 Tax=viral metagenome TaxID=1070528 RepID=A0A6C0EC81_9ZZZZ
MNHDEYKFQKVKYQLNILISTDNIKIKQFYKKFASHHNGDSGIDLYNDEILVESFSVGTIDFKIKCEMIDIETNEYTSYYLAPRSSIGKTSFQLTNSIGIIDAGYRGNLMAKIRNFNIKNSEILNEGSFFQIIAPDLKPIKINIKNELSSTSRNDGAFGSTNLKQNIEISNVLALPSKITQTICFGNIEDTTDTTKEQKEPIKIDSAFPDKDTYTLFFDGCSKNNPGKSGAGASIINNTANEIWSQSKYIGNATNNKAEYESLLLGLNGAIELNIKKLIVKGDSKLVIKQLSGNYKIKSDNLLEIFNEINEKIKFFDTILFFHINRKDNKRADELANKALININ